MVRSQEGAAMTDESYTDQPRGLTAKLRDLTGGAGDMVRAACKEAMSWDAYNWTVLALLTATFLLVALSYGGIRAELAALKESRGTSAESMAAINAEIGKQMTDLKAGLMQALSEMKSDMAKMGAKLDARSAPKPAAPAPKPVTKPKTP
jgi:hypothetical protein